MQRLDVRACGHARSSRVSRHMLRRVFTRRTAIGQRARPRERGYSWVGTEQRQYGFRSPPNSATPASPARRPLLVRSSQRAGVSEIGVNRSRAAEARGRALSRSGALRPDDSLGRRTRYLLSAQASVVGWRADSLRVPAGGSPVVALTRGWFCCVYDFRRRADQAGC
jgi:hypothetical protein